MLLADRVIDAYFGCQSALRSLTAELNDTPESRLCSLLHAMVLGLPPRDRAGARVDRRTPMARILTRKHLLYLVRVTVLHCKSLVVNALADILADMDIVIEDIPLLMLLIRRNNPDLVRKMLRHHFVTRDVPPSMHSNILSVLTMDTVDTDLAALVTRKFGLSRLLAAHLRHAVKLGDMPTCLKFIRIGAPLEPEAYISAAARGRVDICELYLDAGFQEVRAFNNKALRVAASRGHMPMCRHIIHVALPRTSHFSSGGRTILDDIRDYNNEAFRWAAGHGHLEVCKLLLACGLQLSDIRADRNNAFRWAAGGGHMDVCLFLLDQGLLLEDICAIDNEAFRMAASHGHTNIVRLLLTCGLTLEDVRAKDNYALRRAARMGHTDICELLLCTCGLTLEDIRTANNEAFRLAAEFGHVEICKLLRRCGLRLDDIRAVDNEAFRVAASHGHLAVCKLLVHWGLTRADISVRNNEALRRSTERGFGDVSSFLLSLNLLDNLPWSQADKA